MKLSKEKLEKIYNILERAHLFGIPPKDSLEKIKSIIEEEEE